MPTYDYECGACGEVTEFFQRFSEAPKRKCPSCGKLRLKRLIGSGGGIIFRGSGFYETDYRSEDYKKKAKAEAEIGKKSSDDSKKSEGASKSGGGDAGSSSKSERKGEST